MSDCLFHKSDFDYDDNQCNCMTTERTESSIASIENLCQRKRKNQTY